MIYLKTSIGIEMRQDELVISCLRSNFSGQVFTDFGRIKDFRTRDRGEVRREVEGFFKARRLKTEFVVLGIPRQEVITRNLDLPAEVEDNLKQIIAYQVQSFEPSEEEKFYYDFIRAGAKEPGKRLQIFLVLIRKSVLDSHLSLLKELGIVPVAVSLGSVALANLFLRQRGHKRDKTFVLANLKEAAIELGAVRDGFLLYSRETPKPEGISWRNLLMNELGQAVGKLRLGPDETIEDIVLAGEGAETARDELRTELEDCALIDSHIPFEMPEHNRAHLLEGAVSLGLAYSGIVRRPPFSLNLLPAEKRLQQTRWAYVPAMVLGLVVLMLFAALGFRRMIQEQIFARKVNQEIASLQPRFNAAQKLQADVRELEKRVVFVEGLHRQSSMNLELLQELTRILPTDTFLNNYQNREGIIQLAGASRAAPELVPLLEKSPLLKNVRLRGSTYTDQATGKERFTIEAHLER